MTIPRDQNGEPVRVGDVLRVYDADAWQDAGHDFRDNSMFFQEATVLAFEPHYQDGWRGPTATVRFHYHGKTSRGHFVNMTERLR
jgi:hypothetical protein